MNPVWPLQAFRYCPHCGSKAGGAVSIKQFVCQECRFEFFSNAAAAVIALIPNPAGEILFTRRARNPARGKLDLPGGFVDPMETAEAALEREIHEELGLTIRKFQFLGSFPNRYDYKDVTYYTTDLLFICQVPDLSITPETEEITEAVFLSPDEVKQDEVGLISVWNALGAFIKRRDSGFVVC